MNGSNRVCLRNRRFIKKTETSEQNTPIIDVPITVNTPAQNHENVNRNDIESYQPSEPELTLVPKKVPRALKQLTDHNKPGLKEPIINSKRRQPVHNV